MLSEERRRAIEAEEAERIAEEAYRREVRSRMAQPEPTYPTLAISTFDQDEESKGGVRFWQVLALVAVAVAVTYAYAKYDTDLSSAIRAAKAAAAPLRSKPRYQPMRRPVSDGQIVVQAGGWVTYRLRIEPEMRNAVLTGSFRAAGGMGNDVAAVVATESEFQNWINGHEARVVYSSGGRKTTDSFKVALPQGEYILAISNKFSIVSLKTVFLNADLSYETAVEPTWNPFANTPSGS